MKKFQDGQNFVAANPQNSSTENVWPAARRCPEVPAEGSQQPVASVAADLQNLSAAVLSQKLAASISNKTAHPPQSHDG
ncbi:MAG TPA: hypothetical protein VHA33_07845 [Candidatus Angelobacter sp.]|jgi:hypothetical protein|nr:hypothetical protein [Candidatus Angelobacter sp.]